MSDDISQRDPNRVTSLLGVDKISFLDVVTVAADPVTHELLAQITGTVAVINQLTNYALESGGNLDSIDATLASILTQFDVALSTRLAEATFTARINTLGQKTMANSTPVVLPSDQSAIPVTSTDADNKAATGTTSVTSVGTSVVTILASNANRKGFTIYNDGGTAVYIKFASGATTGDFTNRLTSQSYQENNWPVYTGIITAIRGTGTGNVIVTELT